MGAFADFHPSPVRRPFEREEEALRRGHGHVAVPVMIGVGRQTINRLLKSLEQDGIATAKYTSATIHDIEAIERLSLSEGTDGEA